MHIKKILAAVLVLGFLFPACQQQPSPKTSSETEFKIDYEKYTLDNGLEVILHQDDSDPIVAVAILFHVGSSREVPGRTGFAHFFEHMLFQNSENVGKGNFFRIIEELGGDFNGGTWNDGTIYYEVVPRNALEKVLWMESDRMGFVINTVTEAVLENEKQVVKNEKRQRVDNQPYGHTSYVIDKALYPKEHPYNWQVIGSLEDLEAATIADVKEFYDKYYGPNNATMVIAGDIDVKQTKAFVEKYFAEIPAREEAPTIEPQAGQLSQTVKLMHEDNFAQLPELRMVWPTVADGHPDSYALDYLGELLSDGKRAPLYQVIVEDRKLAPSTSTNNSEMEIAGEFTLRVRANAGVDLDSVQAAVFEAFDQFEQEGINDKDMQRIRNKQEKDFYASISSIFAKSWQLAQMNEFRGSPDALEEEVKQILSVTKEDIIRVYEKYIKDKPYVLTSFVPKGQAELAVAGSATAKVVEEEIVPGAEPAPMPETDTAFAKTPSRIDRSLSPSLEDSPTVKAPKIWSETLANQLEVFGIENSELPLVEFSLRLKGAMLLEPQDKIGLTNLLAASMQEGTRSKTPEELEDAIGQLGADITISSGSEYLTLEGSCLARNFEQVLALAEEMLLEPRWDEKEFERLQSSTLTQIQQAKGQPNTIGSQVFVRQIYGENNILSESSSGTQKSVSAITIDDLKAYYEQNFSPSIASFHVSGAVPQPKVLSALESLEEKWPVKEVSLPTLPAPEVDQEPRLYFVDVPNSKQSVIRVGMPSVRGNDEDYYGINFVNYRLGNGSTARLFQQLREERGYTYGAYSSIPRRINPSFLVVQTSVRSNVTKESVGLIKQILEQYQEEYSKEDLEITKNTLLRSNALAFETLNDKLDILQNISTFDLPLDYIKIEEEVVTNMTLDRAKELIGKYFNPSEMIYIVVGDGKTQVEPLKATGIKGPVMLDKEGMPVKQVLN